MSILIPHAWIDDPGRHEKVKEIYERIQQNFEAIALNGTTQAYVDGEIADVVAGGINFGSPSATINAGDSAVEGVSTDATRADHQHAVSTAAATSISGTNSEGTATSLARSDHSHAFTDGTISAAKLSFDVATQAELDAHTGDTSDAHDASAISFSPAGTLAATDAQAAIEEAASEAATALSTHEADTTSIHGIADTSVLATASSVATAVSNHDADTTVHGIDTANVPTSDEKDALVGTSGSPSGSNPYVTDEDNRLNLFAVPYSDALLALTPSLYWRFTETSGTAVDDSTANNRDGTTTGTVTRNVTGALVEDVDPGIDLGGGWVTSSYDPFTDSAARTFVGWASGDDLISVGDEMNLFGAVPTALTGFGLSVDDTNVYVRDHLNASPLIGWAPPADGTYFMFAFVVPGTGGYSVYMDGQAVFSSTSQALSFADSTTLTVGDAPLANPWDGKMDEFAVFEKALTPAQIEWLYNLGSGQINAIPRSIGTTKGDLIGFSAASTPDNLTVGANDTLLVADSGQTLGVKWANVTSAMITNGTVTDTDLASPNNSVYKTLFQSQGVVGLDYGALTFVLGSVTDLGTGVSAISTEALGLATASMHPPFIFYFDDADYTVAGKTTVMRLRAQVAANATAPTINFTFGLYPVTVAGAADNLVYTTGTVVSSSTVAINTPSASTVTSGVNSDFTIPADGAYVLGCATSGTIANNSAVSLHAQLQIRHT